jgi:CRP-like cAMP-binding protein
LLDGARIVTSYRSPNHFIAALSAEDFALLEPLLTPVELRPGDLLRRAECPVSHVYFPHRGIVSTSVRFASGQFVEAGLTGRNSVIGIGAALHGAIAYSDATVQVSGSGVMAKAGCLKQLVLDHPTLRDSFVRHREMVLAQAQRIAACNAVHSVEQRLSRLLLQAHDLVDGDALPFTQDVLSQMLGVQRSSVAVVAERLRSAGVIAYHRGKIRIRDVPGLESACCECYRAINAQYLRLTGWMPASFALDTVADRRGGESRRGSGPCPPRHWIRAHASQAARHRD